MSGKRRRGRRRAGGGEGAGQPQGAAGGTPELPGWDWRTFPVFFALVAGMFLGTYIGVAAQTAGNSAVTLVLIALAVPVGFALSRVFVRYALMGRFIKPRQRK